MLSKVFVPLFLLFSFAGILATAAPGQLLRRVPQTTVTVTTQDPAPTTISQCNTGDAQCCITVSQANQLPGLSLITGLLGIVLGDLTAVVGIGCSPITVIGLGSGANCAQQPVCCENNSFGGLLSIGCNPISL